MATTVAEACIAVENRTLGSDMPTPPEPLSNQKTQSIRHNLHNISPPSTKSPFRYVQLHLDAFVGKPVLKILHPHQILFPWLRFHLQQIKHVGNRIEPPSRLFEHH